MIWLFMVSPKGNLSKAVYGQPQGEPRQRYDMGVYGQPQGEPKHQTSNPSHADTNCGGPKTSDIPLHEKELGTVENDNELPTNLKDNV
ncbi:hypothetical protein LXL04_010557 [Taraxacum kok-saghyz]